MLPIQEENGLVSLDLHPIHTDEQLGRVVEILEDELDAQVIRSSAYPGYRESVLRIDGVTLTLKHSSLLGNSIESRDPAARAVIERVRAHFALLLGEQSSSAA